MTPAIKQASQANIQFEVHEYTHDPKSESYGLEAADKLGVIIGRVFKTLIVQLNNNDLVVGIVPVSSMLSMKNIARAAGAKKAVMAAKSDVERSTGYILGGVSPLGQKRKLKSFIHASINDYETIFVSAGRRGLEIELRPVDLVKLVKGVIVDISS